MTVPEAHETLDIHPDPQSATYLADLDWPRLQEVHGMAFVQLDDGHLQSSTA